MRTRSALALALLASACGTLAVPEAREILREPVGDEILVCGEAVRVGAPVVLWSESPYYSAYRNGPRFRASDEAKDRGPRCDLGRRAREGWTVVAPGESDLDTLRGVVDQLVLHYDVAGTSRNCFKVLQDERKLSAHFLLDLDGTIYQTLDLGEQAWHARAANPRSIGVEIANVGAYPREERARLARWYEWTEEGTRLSIPASLGDGGLRTAFSARPARSGPIAGPIHGATYVQHDFTSEQYESLAALAAALARVLPRIELDAPRDEGGAVRTDALTDDEEAAFHGVLGHYHLQTDKRDPGPAFDWERFLEAARARIAQP